MMKLIIFFIISVFCTALMVQAEPENSVSSSVLQGIAITGTVTDADGEPLPGVNVLIQGTNQGTVTNPSGAYSLQAPNDNAILVFSFLGYATQEVLVGSQRIINVTLSEDARQIEEVVVVAYGTQKMRQVTGSMARLNTEELSDMPVSNMAQKLQGKLSGVQIYHTTGEPNSGLFIRVRGQASINAGNTPLIVIDGFPSNMNFSDLSPDEIENITVLKDAASAALYGSRAANGVILVTTKTAKAGQVRIEFNTNLGFAKVGNRGKPDIMNAQEFARFKKEYFEDQIRY